MKLHWSPKSPFVRKVVIAARELGVIDRIELVRTVASMIAPNRDLMRDNPLGKIPVLVLDDGEAVYDSLVICDHLQAIANTDTIIPGDPERRRRVLTRHAEAGGLLDLLILARNERERSGGQDWLEPLQLKAKATLDHLDGTAADWPDDGSFRIDAITLMCALGYLDFRFADWSWRTTWSRLDGWHRQYAARPSVVATEIVDG